MRFIRAIKEQAEVEGPRMFWLGMSAGLLLALVLHHFTPCAQSTVR